MLQLHGSWRNRLANSCPTLESVYCLWQILFSRELTKLVELKTIKSYSHPGLITEQMWTLISFHIKWFYLKTQRRWIKTSTNAPRSTWTQYTVLSVPIFAVPGMVFPLATFTSVQILHDTNGKCFEKIGQSQQFGNSRIVSDVVPTIFDDIATLGRPGITKRSHQYLDVNGVNPQWLDTQQEFCLSDFSDECPHK